jgi:hypothetical protein
MIHIYVYIFNVHLYSDTYDYFNVYIYTHRIDNLIDTMLVLYPVALSVVNLTQSNGIGGGGSDLILLAGKCLQASEVLKVCKYIYICICVFIYAHRTFMI